MMQLYKNISQLISLKGAHNKDGRNLGPSDLSIIENAALVFDKDDILWVGKTADIPSKYNSIQAKDLTGHVLTPEIVDSHTHLVFAGDRSHEYTARLNGEDYQKIAQNGGGILSTMKSTVEVSEDELFVEGIKRIERIHSYGVGSIEIKSGYGLTYESEKKISQIIHKLKEHFKGRVQIFNTYLAAHAVPENYSSSAQYINELVIPLLYELHKSKVIDFIDIFHEEGYFDYSDSKRLFDVAVELGIKTKIHADEFNDNKGAILACVYNSVSADHLLKTSADGIKALAQSNTVATLLPGTAFFLGKPLANARGFLDAGCKVSLASDYNPGSCHCDNLLLIASLSAKSLNLNICELWAAITLNASAALGLSDQGVIKEGFKPRFTIFECETLDQITYSWGRNFSKNPKFI